MTFKMDADERLFNAISSIFNSLDEVRSKELASIVQNDMEISPSEFRSALAAFDEMESYIEEKKLRVRQLKLDVVAHFRSCNKTGQS